MTALLGTIIHGLCQGNTAAPAGWSVICSILQAAYKRRGHGAKFRSPISGVLCETAGVLYVDDVNLLTMNGEVEEALQLWDEAQPSRVAWAEVLNDNDSGGFL
jgi:hypothetical protein